MGTCGLGWEKAKKPCGKPKIQTGPFSEEKMGLLLLVVATLACAWDQNKMGARAQAGSWGQWDECGGQSTLSCPQQHQ